jgi:hypothetical protein
MRLQIASDLHLEVRPKVVYRELLDPGVAPCLALLGDIAPLNHPNLRPFLEWCSEHWETVIWIPGRLELLGPGSGNEGAAAASGQPDLAAAAARAKALAEPFWNVTVLDHEGMVSTDGIYIFGLPFWRFPPEYSDEHRVLSKAPTGYVWHPGFFRYVEAEPSPASPEFLRAEYNRDLRWLKQTAKTQTEPIIILSHYGPTPWIQEEGFVGDPDRSTTFPDVEELLKAPIVAWLCGHCHQSTLFQKEWADITGAKGTVLIANNPKGLPLENPEYRRDAVVRIDPALYGRPPPMGGGRPAPYGP